MDPPPRSPPCSLVLLTARDGRRSVLGTSNGYLPPKAMCQLSPKKTVTMIEIQASREFPSPNLLLMRLLLGSASDLYSKRKHKTKETINRQIERPSSKSIKSPIQRSRKSSLKKSSAPTNCFSKPMKTRVSCNPSSRCSAHHDASKRSNSSCLISFITRTTRGTGLSKQQLRRPWASSRKIRIYNLAYTARNSIVLVLSVRSEVAL